VLADEINRATPKTQSAVLEAMAEQTVSVARTSHRLPAPFMVLATQNPIEMEGTYPLPEAQIDRFLLKIAIVMPSRSELVEIIDRTTAQPPRRPRKVADASQLLAMRELVRQVKLAGPLKDAIAAIVLATHPDAPSAPPLVRRAVRYGASPRGAQGIALAAKVLALRDGRGNVSLDDVRSVAAPSLRHRLVLSYEGQADGVEPDQIIAEVMNGPMLNG
jgi:MoxR-like ATPase